MILWIADRHMSVENIVDFNLFPSKYFSSNENWKEVTASSKLDDGWAQTVIGGQGCLSQDYETDDSLVQQQGALCFLNYLQLMCARIAVDFGIAKLKKIRLMFTIGSY